MLLVTMISVSISYLRISGQRPGDILKGNKDMAAWRRAFLWRNTENREDGVAAGAVLTIMTLVLVDTAISQASEGTAARLQGRDWRIL